MKAFVLLSSLLLYAFSLSLSSPLKAATFWEGDGVYTFDQNSDYFLEGVVQDTATLNILGGSFRELLCRDYSTVNMYGGNATWSILLDDFSTLNLHGGTVNYLGAMRNSAINMWAENCSLNSYPYIGYDGILSGNWLDNGQFFSILLQEGTYSYIAIVPEPGSIFMLGMGMILLRKTKH